MNKTINKFSAIGLSVTTAVWLSGAGMLMPMAAQAVTVEELQVQIQALLEQITSLNTQLATLQGGAAPSVTFTRSLTLGDTGADVLALQQFLNANGAPVAASDAGSLGNETEYFGSLTKAATAVYQDLHAAQILTPLGLSAGTGYFGPSTMSYINSLAAVVGEEEEEEEEEEVPSGFSLALSAGNPGSTTVAKGATGVEFVKFNVSGSGTLNSLTFKRMGIGATGDFGSSGFYLYEGDTRLTSGRSINSTTHEVSFNNLSLEVSGTKTLSLVADIDTGSGATAGNIHYFTLISATGDPTPSGSLTGNPMTIGGQSVGTITADDGAAPTNPKVGQSNALLLNLKLTAGSTAEDIEIIKISLTEGGTISNSNLTNFVLKRAGETLATASAIGAKDLITFVFDTPYLLEKGQERTFEIRGDIAGATRSNDTIILYIDSASDVSAIGKTYGYAVTPTISSIDTTTETDTLTVQGGQLTITLNGPLAGDISKRAQDIEVLNFTIASQNNIEIRNLRFTASTSNIISGEGFPDFKIWDTGTSAVITSATDITTTTSTSVVFTDTINISAGETKTFKATVDVDADNDASDTLRIDLAAFVANDVKNLDNNTYVAITSIVPNGITGNVQTVQAPTLTVTLAGTPSSKTIVRGTQNVSFTGISLRASADDIKITTLRVTATATTGTLTSGEIQSLGLYDGATLVSELKSLDSSALTATFSNLDYTVAKGQTKILTVIANVASDATDADVYYIDMASIGTDDITAYDSDGNTATVGGTIPNSSGTVTITVTTAGTVTVAKASDDTDSEAGIVIAGNETTLAKFKWTSANEAMTINKMRLLVVPTDSATATSSAVSDDVLTIKLYESNGTTVIGDAAGYTITGAGVSSGIVTIEDLGWTIPKDDDKVMVVKGILNTIANGADSGQSIYVSVMGTSGTTFEAQGASNKLNSLTAATGNQKVVYKTKPTLSLAGYDNTGKPSSSSKLSAGEVAVLRFDIAADSGDDVSWGKIQLYVQMTGATMTAVDSAPGTTGTVKIKNLSTGSNLNIGTAYSGSAVGSTGQATITGGNAGYVSLTLASDEVIAASTDREYEITLTFSNLSSTVGAAYIVLKLNKEESSLLTATAYNTVETSTEDGQPSFIWSDNSAVTHSHTSSDWANSVYVKTLPSNSVTIQN
ncbi:MAG: hypothetical protein V3T98_02040 [Candidatus Paceibacterota bacterium]